jgi:DNA-binding NtrC family response regulator
MKMSDVPGILIIDDEPSILNNCKKILTRSNYHVATASNGYDAISQMEETAYDVVITDLKMSRMGGLAVIGHIRECHPEIRVIVITGYASVASAVEVMKSGAFDYLPKPFTPDELRSVVVQALADAKSARLNRELMDGHHRATPVSHQLVGGSAKIKKVVSMIGKVAPTDATVLVCGESGTGKELVARAVHANSNRKEKVFFAVDCATLSKNLLESELFGYARGAFTGADKNKDGIFSLADNGTVFLDEISNIGLDVQGKLLRFLESREFFPLGAGKSKKVDIRLIFATNKNLKDMVDDGLFREDFYYRIFVYPIILPPLRDRKDDILPIAYHFLNRFSEKMGKSLAGFSEDAVNRLMQYEWPGNIRQLRNVVERAIILCEGDRIVPKDLSLSRESDEVEQMMDAIPETNEELKRLKKEIREKAVGRVEKNFILNALLKSQWNITKAAENVGIQRSNFQNLMKKHGITKTRNRNTPA